MITVISYLAVFLIGGLFNELVRAGQERYRLWQVSRAAIRHGDSLETVARGWAASPRNWCSRPGCPRCWGRRWGR
ncbi:hypothetical protein ACFMQL_00705 [Nonomuraea fastidiosa]|jgi:hypothetical protein|uniref:hypothetical protein n=1 Tax=Nonomuraea TaxID=83681 RepID=UPI00343A0ACC